MTADADPQGPDPFVTGPHLRMWLASTLAIEALVIPALVLALSGAPTGGPLIASTVTMVSLLVAPLGAWVALVVCRRESALEPLTRSGIVSAHVAVGFAFGAGVPVVLALVVGLWIAVSMAFQGQGLGGLGVLGVALCMGMMLAVIGLLVSLPLSVLGGVAALAAARRPA